MPENFAIVDAPLPEPGPGQVVVRNVYMSVDPAMRGRMEQTEKHYTTNFEVGDPLDGSAIGEVVVRRSRASTSAPMCGIASAGATSPSSTPRPQPSSTRSSLPCRTGSASSARPASRRTSGWCAQARWTKGDTVFVSAAAGAVGSAAGQFAKLLGAGPGHRQRGRAR